MNIAITNICNRKCPFCYQREIMEKARKSKETEISLENFAYVLDFIKKSGEDKLHMVGGEPTLHRKFEDIMEMVGNDSSIRQVVLFTNGQFKPQIRERIMRYANKILISISILEPKYERPEGMRRLYDNLKVMSQEGVLFDFSYVVSEPDFDPSFIFDYMDKYGVRSLRWALSFPVADGAAHIPKESLKKIGNAVIPMLKTLTSRGVRAYVDCPLPYCIFSDEDMGYLSREAMSVINWGYCGLTLEVNPDLTVKACPIQREVERVPLSFFRNMQEMERYFFAKMSVYKANHMLFKDCSDCRYYHNSRCQGGCLGYSKPQYQDILINGTTTLGHISENQHVIKLPFMAVMEKGGQRYIYSSVSPQVEPEAIDEQCFKLWQDFSSTPTVASLLKDKSLDGKKSVMAFIEHLQRIGFIDLIEKDV